jgi:predicted aspartyl protease
MAVITALALAMVAGVGNPTTDSAQTFPVILESGHFYAVPETTGGQRLKLLVDTGGGYYIDTATAKRLRLPLHQESVGGTAMTMTYWPRFMTGRGVPLNPSIGNAVFVVETGANPQGIDGIIGGPAFVDHAWTFNYANHSLTRLAKGWQADPKAHRIALGFAHDEEGHLHQPYPRMTIRVNDAPVDMLLDTGATAHATLAGKQASGLATTAGTGVTSYITTSLFERWHRAHPEWRVIDNGDDLLSPRFVARLIEVPNVDVAGWTVGPIWFTERPDSAFHNEMSSYMDKQIEGSVGGNVFIHFVITIDYVGEAAYFHCVSGCKPSKPPPAP